MNPKKIAVTKKAAEKFKKAMDESKKRIKEKMKESIPPEEIREWMRKKAHETDKINGGTLDKNTFMLGMMAMWSYMDKKAKETGK